MEISRSSPLPNTLLLVWLCSVCCCWRCRAGPWGHLCLRPTRLRNWLSQQQRHSFRPAHLPNLHNLYTATVMRPAADHQHSTFTHNRRLEPYPAAWTPQIQRWLPKRRCSRSFLDYGHRCNRTQLRRRLSRGCLLNSQRQRHKTVKKKQINLTPHT